MSRSLCPPSVRLLCGTLLVALGLGPARAGVSDDVAAARRALQAWDVPGAAEAAERAFADAPADPGALLVMGQLRIDQGRYADAVEILEQAVLLGVGDAAKHYRALAASTAEATEGYEEHLTSGGHFLVRHAPGRDAVLVPYIDAVLEQAWERLTALFEHQPPYPVRVEVYPEVEVLGAVSSLTVEEIKASGTIALCKYNRLMITSPGDLVYGYGWADTLSHEFIHMLVSQKSGNTVPIWLHEGLAKYHEGFWQPDHRPQLARRSEHLLAEALAADKLVSFEAMSPSMAKLPDQETTATAFAEVHMVLDYLIRRHGKDAGRRLVELMGEGLTDKEAVAQVAGLSWSRFEPSWRAWLGRRGLKTMDAHIDLQLLFKGSHTEADEIELLEARATRRYLWLGDRLAMDERWKAAAKEYQKASAEVGDKVPFVQAKLGRALLRLGKVQAAVDALRTSLPLYPDYMLLRLYLGEAYLRLGRLEEARAELEHAIRINPFDPDVHELLAEVYDGLALVELAARERGADELLRRRAP